MTCARSLLTIIVLAVAALSSAHPSYAAVCSWAGSQDACRQAPEGSVCAINGVAGICAITNRTMMTCQCVYGAPQKTKTPKCPKGQRWSAVKSSCLTPMRTSPDGRTRCIADGLYFDVDNNVCSPLF